MSKLTKILLVVALMGAIVGGIGVPDAIKLWKNDISSVEDIKPGDIKAGEMYEGDIPDALDVVAKETTTQSYGFVPVSKTETPYYIVELENGYVVIDVTNKKKQDEFETLMDQTWDYFDGKTNDKPSEVSVSTTVIKMPDKVKEYLHEYCCDEGGMSEQEYAELVETACCLKTIEYKNTKFIPIIGFGVTLLCVIILIVKKAASPKVVNL